MAGGGVQTLTHSDGRLKGLAALSTVSTARPGSQEGGAESLLVVEEAASSKGYVATYRLITGRGFGHFHLWEVTLDARAGASHLGSPAGASSIGIAGSTGLTYRQTWRHLYQGTINGPTLGFAHFVERVSPNVASSAAGGTLSLWEQCQQRALLDQNRGGSVAGALELMVSERQKDLRLVALSGSVAGAGSGDSALAASKPQPLKDTVGMYACSRDGLILFGGQYELVVMVLESVQRSTGSAWGAGSTMAGTGGGDGDDSAVPRIASRTAFSLSDFAPGVVGRSSKKTSRHLREISDVWCTPDGAYAVILCTDNAVLLYRYAFNIAVCMCARLV